MAPREPEPKERELTPDELAEQQAADLPDRDAMSLLPPDLAGVIDNFAMPINEASAVNYYSPQSVAIAQSDQYAIIDQTDVDPDPDPDPDEDDRPDRGRRDRD
jgi:hypothetical protein